MKKYIYGLLSCGLIVVTLAGCSKTTNETNKTASSTLDDPSTEETTTIDDSKSDVTKLFDAYENFSGDTIKLDENFTVKRVEENDFFNAHYAPVAADATFSTFVVKIGRCEEGGSNCDYLATEDSYLDVYEKEERSVASGTLDINGTDVYYSIEQQESDGEKSTFALLGWRQGNFFLNGQLKEYWEISGDTLTAAEAEDLMQDIMTELLEATGDGM